VQKDVERAGFGWCVENDWFKNNWRKMHEDKHRGYRKTQILRSMITGGGQALDSTTSYSTELMAIASALMNVPGGWDIEIITDSEAAIKSIKRTKKVTIRNSEWQLLDLTRDIIQKRKGKTTLTHQKSHKKQWTKESVGNAAADLIADIYTESREREGTAAEIPLTYNGQTYTIHEKRTGKILTQDIRKTIRRQWLEEADENWGWTSSRGDQEQNRRHRNILQEKTQEGYDSEETPRSPGEGNYSGSHAATRQTTEQSRCRVRVL